MVQGRVGGAPTALMLVIVIWWLLIAGVIAFTLPTPAASAPIVGGAVRPGWTGRVHLPGLSDFPIPIERAAFDEAQRGFREGDEDAIDHAFTAYEWLRVSHGQAVRITATDGEVVEVELLEGLYAGRRGWMKSRQLSP